MSATSFAPDPQPRKKPLQYADLTQDQTYNVALYCGHYNQEIRVQRFADGRVSFMTTHGREVPIEEILHYAKKLKNALTL